MKKIILFIIIACYFSFSNAQTGQTTRIDKNQGVVSHQDATITTNLKYAKNPTAGYYLKCLDSQGNAVWAVVSGGGSSDSTYTSIQMDSILKYNNNVLYIEHDTVYMVGKLGINDATPGYQLDVNGTGRFVDTLNANSSVFMTSLTSGLTLDSIAGFNTSNELGKFGTTDLKTGVEELTDVSMDIDSITTSLAVPTIRVADSLIDVSLATSNTTVLTVTATGKIDTLETADLQTTIEGLELDSIHVNQVRYNITTVNAATYDLLATDNILHVTYTVTGAVTSLTLPTAQVIAGRTIVIKDTGNASVNSITIDTEGSETIDGAATYLISLDYESVSLYCDGTNWFVY